MDPPNPQRWSAPDRHAHALSWAGLVRERNEDSVLFRPDLGLFGVFDGLGGHAGGQVASSVAAEAIEHGAEHGPQDLVSALCSAHDEIKQRSMQNSALYGMGTTAAVCQISGNMVRVAWAGDSRVYALSQSGELKQVTKDHSVVGKLLDRGMISVSEAAEHPQQHALTSCLGSFYQPPDIDLVRLEVGDIASIILCTDGLTDLVSGKQIEETLDRFEDRSLALDDLLRMVEQSGARDNLSIVIVSLVS